MDTNRKRISCQRCRNRKLKCSRSHPCSSCTSSGTECIFRVDDARRRPVGRGYVTALEEKISSYEQLLRNLRAAPDVQRELMLTRVLDENLQPSNDPGASVDSTIFDYTGSSRLSTMSIQCDPQGVPSFYGPTSIYQDNITAPHPETTSSGDAHRYPGHWQDMRMHLNLGIGDSTIFRTFSSFFTHQHSQCMFIDRQTFLRDYLSLDCGGQYWSYPLLYAICALGAKASTDKNLRKDAQRLCQISQEMLNTPGLQYPDMTVIQSLLCCAFFELSMGNHSKGWMLSGMAFRMAQDLGFHQDPRFVMRDSAAGDVTHGYEMRRRMYWGCYIADKIISLYFGRPMLLHREDAAVDSINLTAIPRDENIHFDIPELEASISPPEDQATFSIAFSRLIDLCTIIEDVLSQIFSTRLIKKPRKELVLARLARLEDLNIRLLRWHSELPDGVAWNQWKPATHGLSSHVMLAHALYHSTLIALNRNFIRPTPGFARKEQSKEICISSADSIIALVRQYRAKSPLLTAPVVLLYSTIMAASALSFSGNLGGLGENSQMASDSRVSFVLKVLEEFSAVHRVAGMVGRQFRRGFEGTSQPQSPGTDVQQAGVRPGVQGWDEIEGLEFGSDNLGYGLGGEDAGIAGIAGTSMEAGFFELLTWDLTDLQTGDLRGL
ncbi:fungal-specific transcription factor domain-containing protein [Aspergillus spectabilis]